MPKRTLEYRCLLISPSDVASERDALTQMVRTWNAHIGKGLGARVELVRWESHSVPDLSAPAQDVINRDLLDECDFGIAVFWSKLGTPTKEHASGSVEEITRLLQRGARVMVYFSERDIPKSQLNLDQLARLEQVRKQFQSEGLLSGYTEISELCTQVNLHLTSLVIQLLAKDTGSTELIPSSGTLTAPTPDVRVKVGSGWSESEVRPPTFALFITVQNHSPIPVYINSVYLETNDHSLVIPNGDYLSGDYLYPRELQPGRSSMLSVDPSQIEQYRENNRLACAVARDEIGRVYRSSTDEFARALDLLFDYYLRPEKWANSPEPRDAL